MYLLVFILGSSLSNIGFDKKSFVDSEISHNL